MDVADEDRVLISDGYELAEQNNENIEFVAVTVVLCSEQAELSLFGTLAELVWGKDRSIKIRVKTHDALQALQLFQTQQINSIALLTINENAMKLESSMIKAVNIKEIEPARQLCILGISF